MPLHPRRDALQQAIVQAIRYQCLEWDLTREDVLSALSYVRAEVRRLFDANRPIPRKPQSPRNNETDE